MKAYQFCIIFMIFSVTMMLLREESINEELQVKNLLTDNKTLFDKAVDAAVDRLRAYNENDWEYAADEAVSSFYDSLYASLDIMDSPDGRESLKLYIPAIIISDNEGYYVYFTEDVSENDFKELKIRRSEKQYYIYSESNAPEGKRATDFIMRFTGKESCIVSDFAGVLGSKMQVFDYGGNENSELTELLLKNNYYSILTDLESFELKRRELMAGMIENSLKYYCNVHNSMAHQNGVEYEFNIPDYDGELFLQAADGVAFWAFFQGYPIKGSDKFYNCFTVSNARVVEK
ncbi:MAG: hypothetical protein MJ131_02695 [Lachnospiraceae bacterium]|nr:hypothetical protein [Lachnospiraceae bacterium]